MIWTKILKNVDTFKCFVEQGKNIKNLSGNNKF